MPPGIMERLHAAVSVLLTKKQTIEHLHSDTAEPAGGTPSEFLDRISGDIALWRKVVADSGIHVE
jgi:tripartite-type tricarboxylate transporter receptor subunit TctC